jgi:hypothetical protein
MFPHVTASGTLVFCHCLAVFDKIGWAVMTLHEFHSTFWAVQDAKLPRFIWFRRRWNIAPFRYSPNAVTMAAFEDCPPLESVHHPKAGRYDGQAAKYCGDSLGVALSSEFGGDSMY